MIPMGIPILFGSICHEELPMADEMIIIMR
jgi:hypothetical protein